MRFIAAEMSVGSVLTGVSLAGGSLIGTANVVLNDDPGFNRHIMMLLMGAAVATLLVGLFLLLHGWWRTAPERASYKITSRGFMASFPCGCALVSSGATIGVTQGFTLLVEASNPYWPLYQTAAMACTASGLFLLGCLTLFGGSFYDRRQKHI